MPQPFVTRSVVRAVQELPGFPNLSVLDLSCGEGEILSQLAGQGCRVQGTHFREDDYIVQQREWLTDVPVRDGVNLQQRLPFDDASFDVVMLVEVIEHLDSHFNIVAEMGRVVKPGGYVVITSPNIFRLHSRFQFLLTGKHKIIRRRFGWDLAPESRYAYHIAPPDFPLLHTLLYHAGLDIEQLRFTKFKPKSALFMLLWPLVWLSCRLTVDRPARSSALCRRGETDLNRWLTHPALLASEQLFVLARRRQDDPDPVSAPS
jgi:2-polyprenyl-3-methyl-5-hydroxy-6-metoxy-1,4-benzoquinol methylase